MVWVPTVFEKRAKIKEPQTYDAMLIFKFVEFSSSPSTNGMLTLTTNGDHLPRPIFIPNGMPNTVVPCGTEKNFTNGMVNGHMPSLPDNSFTGYIIAVHRKMVSLMLGKLLLILLFMKHCHFLSLQCRHCVHFRCVIYAVLSDWSQDLVLHMIAYYEITFLIPILSSNRTAGASECYFL